MLKNEEIKSILDEYSKPKNTIIRKEYVDKILKYIDRKEVLVIKGIRRCGKSTILKQVIAKLKDKKCVYVNLDDFRFLEYKNVELLEKILELNLSKEKIYLFLDEIQSIPKFESWLRTHYDKETNVKFIISGSNSSLMSKDLGTVMTGRSLSFEIMPLNFKEFKDFSEGDIYEYLEYGGFPEVVLEKDKERKRELLSNYFNTIIEKDIIEKYSVQQHKQLRELLKYIMSNPGIRISANKLSKQLGISINTVQSYLSLSEQVYLIFEIPFFSYSAKTKFMGSRISKYYSIDSGFTKILSLRFEKSKLVENSVALKFFFERENLYYWFGKNEVDFVIGEKAINVVSDKKIPLREFQGLEEIKKEFKTLKEFFVVNLEENEKSISLMNFLIN
ncbi:MAG: ATP-binding protein [Candidatus Woesearchaeota archaeon]